MNDVILVPRLTYVLELTHSKWYVGITYNVNQRVAEHMQGHGARWTRLHKPTGKIISVAIGDHEKSTTLRMMREKGWQNVRGSSWTKVDMGYPPRELQLRPAGGGGVSGATTTTKNVLVGGNGGKIGGAHNPTRNLPAGAAHVETAGDNNTANRRYSEH